MQMVISADRLKLSRDEPQSGNRCQCRVISEEFIGTVVSLLVEAGDGVELKIQKQQREVEEIGLSQDQLLWVSWSAKDVYVLPQQE